MLDVVCDVYRRCWSGDGVVGWLVVHTYSGFVVLLFWGHVLYCGGDMGPIVGRGVNTLGLGSVGGGACAW